VLAYVNPVMIAVVMAVILLVLTLSLSLYVLYFRWRTQKREEHEQRQLAKWKPLLFGYLGEEIAAPKLIAEIPRGDVELFASSLLDLLHDIEGADLEKLRRLLDDLGITRLYLERLFSEDRWQRIYAAYFLGLVREAAAVARLRIGLEHRDELVSLACAQALAKMQRPEDVLPLLDLLAGLRDLSDDTACEILLDLGPNAADRFLVILSEHDLSPRKQRLLAQLLGFLGHLPAAPALIQFLNTTEDEPLRTRAIEALGRLSSLESVVALEQYLAHGEVDVRQAAAAALGSIGDDAAVKSLAGALNDEDSHVRYAAASSLVRLGHAGREALTTLAAEPRRGHDVEISRQVLAEHELRQ
jgi:hypothetical protein